MLFELVHDQLSLAICSVVQTTRRLVSGPYRPLAQLTTGANVSVIPCHATATV